MLFINCIYLTYYKDIMLVVGIIPKPEFQWSMDLPLVYRVNIIYVAYLYICNKKSINLNSCIKPMKLLTIYIEYLAKMYTNKLFYFDE